MQITCRLVRHSKTKLRLDKLNLLKMKLNESDICQVCRHLNFWGGQRFPVVGFELVEFIKLQANVLDRQLEHVPETCEVLGDGPRVCVWVLIHKNCKTYTHLHMNTHKQSHVVYMLIRHFCSILLQSDDSV